MGKKDKTLVERVNEKLREEIRIIFEEDRKLSKFGHYLKASGVKDIGKSKIVFNNLDETQTKVDLKSIIFALSDLHCDYEDLAEKLFTKSNIKNPYRIELFFEKEDAPEGSLVYSFGKWIVIPFTEGDFKIRKDHSYGISTDLLEIKSPPKNAMIVDKPERHSWSKVDQLLRDYDYKITHFRFANEYDRLPHASLIISNKGPNVFRYRVDPGDKTILEKWMFLIPGLDESYESG